MAIHLSNKWDFILITSNKCAISTVKKSKKTHKLYKKRFVKYFFIFFGHLFIKNKTYMLIRNPYRRIESCYFDKVKNCRMAPNKLNKIFMSVDGFGFGDDIEKNISILRKVSFEEFILKMVPVLHNKDLHLRPQYNSILMFDVKCIPFKIKWRVSQTFRLENTNQMNKLKELTCIDFDIKKNISKRESVMWTDKMYEVIEDVYKKDFSYFDFKKQ